MRLLVTGREGQLSRSLAERASAYAGLQLSFAARPQFDLEQPQALANAIRAEAPDVVINAAAYTAVDRAEDEPDRARLINAEAAGRLAEAAQSAGARFIQISTDYVFDGTGTGPYREDAPTAPIGAYGRSKCEGEEQVRAAAPDNHVILRTAWVYSPFGANFVRTMIRLAQDRDQVNVVGDQRGNPSSALDLADALLALCQRWNAGERTGLGRTYHLAGTGEASWAEFAQAIFASCKANGLPFATVATIGTADYPTRAVRPANSTLDSSAFTRDVGFRMPDWRVSVAGVVTALAEQSRVG
jgi:dTDP-4-dehydrorhamnose reductase